MSFLIKIKKTSCAEQIKMSEDDAERRQEVPEPRIQATNYNESSIDRSMKVRVRLNFVTQLGYKRIVLRIVAIRY